MQSDQPDQTKRQRQQPDGEPDVEAGADQFAAPSHLQRKRDRGESANQTGYEQRRINWSKQNAAPKTHKERRVKTVLPPQQNTQHQRREGVRRDQSAHFRLQKAISAAVANHEQQFCHRELEQDHAKDEKNPRALREAFRLIDPELCNGCRQNKQRDHKILRRFGLLAAENKKSKAADEHRKDQKLCIGRVLEIAQKFASQPAAPGLARCEPALDETRAFQKIEHFPPYLRDAGAGERCCW